MGKKDDVLIILTARMPQWLNLDPVFIGHRVVGSIPTSDNSLAILEFVYLVTITTEPSQRTTEFSNRA